MTTPAPDNFSHTVLSLNPGELLSDRYRLIRIIGQGAMGVVWLAEDVRMDGMKVALKLLPTPFSRDKRAAARLKEEAKRCLAVTHQSIVRLYTFDQDPRRADAAYLVMEYVEGDTLDELLAEHPNGLPLSRVLEIAEPIADAIDFAHEQLLLHRDVKPANIIIDQKGRSRLMDFGIACEVRDTYTRVTGRDSSGTGPYMAPEQLKGEPCRASDIYSLAATVYEALCGRPPFATGDIQWQILHKDPAPLPLLADAANKALLEGLSKDARERPQSAGAFIALLGGGAAAPSTLSRSAARVPESDGKLSAAATPSLEFSRGGDASNGRNALLLVGIGLLLGLAILAEAFWFIFGIFVAASCLFVVYLCVRRRR